MPARCRSEMRPRPPHSDDTSPSLCRASSPFPWHAQPILWCLHDRLFRGGQNDRAADVLRLEERPKVCSFDIVANRASLGALTERFGERQEQRQHADEQGNFLVDVVEKVPPVLV